MNFYYYLPHHLWGHLFSNHYYVKQAVYTKNSSKYSKTLLIHTKKWVEMFKISPFPLTCG